MKIEPNKDGTLLLTPETPDEIIGVQYEIERRGLSATKEMLSEHFIQRKRQRDKEITQGVFAEIVDFPEDIKADILANLKKDIESRKGEIDGQPAIARIRP